MENAQRVRVERVPEYDPVHGYDSWFDGKVLFGHDQSRQAAAEELAWKWMESGERS